MASREDPYANSEYSRNYQNDLNENQRVFNDQGR
jgi:hypothetical protein